MTNYAKWRTNSKESHCNQERGRAVCPPFLSSEAVPGTGNSVPNCISYSITMTLSHGKHSVCYLELLTTSVHPDQQDEVGRAHGFPLPTTSPMCCLRSWDTKPHSVSQPPSPNKRESSLASIQKFTSVFILSLSWWAWTFPCFTDKLNPSKQWTICVFLLVYSAISYQVLVFWRICSVPTLLCLCPFFPLELPWPIDWGTSLWIPGEISPPQRVVSGFCISALCFTLYAFATPSQSLPDLNRVCKEGV